MSTEHRNHDNPSSENAESNESLLSFLELKESDKNKTVSTKPRRINHHTMTLILTAGGTILVSIALLVVVLLGGYLPSGKGNNTVLSPDGVSTPSDDNSASSDETDTTDTEDANKITLLNKTGGNDTDATPMKKVDIQNENGSYTIRYDDDSKLYHLVGYEDILLDVTMLLTLRTHTETIAAVEQIKEASNLAAFGLEEPQATVTITYTDDSTARFFVGDATPSEIGYYGRLEGTDGVYIFESDSVSLFRFRPNAFVRTAILAPPDVKTSDENGTALLKEVTFSGTAHPTPLVMRRSYYNDSEELTYFSYIITKPYTRCTTDSVSNALSQLQSITAEQALILHPTKEEKEKMGFNDPLIDLNVTMAVETEEESETTTTTANSVASSNSTPKIYYNSIDYHIVVGSVDENGNYLTMVDDVDAIFLVSKESYGFFFDCTYQNSVNEFLFLKNIEQLSRISVTLDDETYDFNLTHYPNKEETDDKLVVTMGGKTYSTENFRQLYQLMMGLNRYGVPEKKPTTEVPLEIAMYDSEGNLYLGAKYYNTTGSLCTVETSEGELFTTRWSDVSFFIKQMQNYINGKDVIPNT